MSDTEVYVLDEAAREAGLKVRSGRARINVIDVHVDEPRFLAIEIDLHSKYVEPIVAHGGDSGHEVFLYPSDRAYCLDETSEAMTTVYLPERTAGWAVVAQGGRYTIQIAAWQRPEEES